MESAQDPTDTANNIVSEATDLESRGESEQNKQCVQISFVVAMCYHGRGYPPGAPGGICW